jgi:hypothetical protein
MTTELRRQTYAVLPTPTDVVTLDVRDTLGLSLSVTNLDGSQTVDVELLSNVWDGDDLGESAVGDLLAIGPGETKRFDGSIGNAFELLLRATADGAGCNIRVSARADRGRPR